MTENKENTPQGFDLAGFISRATRPKDVARVYGDGDAVGEMRRLGRLIEQEQYLPEAVREQRGVGQKSLRAQYAELWEKIQASSVDIWLQGHTLAETHEIMGDRKIDRKSDPDGTLRDQVNMELIADAMVVDDGEATVEQMQALRNAIGDQQWKEIEHAYTKACASAVEPSADFLPKSSTPADGQD